MLVSEIASAIVAGEEGTLRWNREGALTNCLREVLTVEALELPQLAGGEAADIERLAPLIIMRGSPVPRTLEGQGRLEDGQPGLVVGWTIAVAVQLFQIQRNPEVPQRHSKACAFVFYQPPNSIA